jgi:hypothetical protein
MFSLLASLKKTCAHFFNRNIPNDSAQPSDLVRAPFTTQHLFSVALPPSVPLLPDFEFRPSDSLLATMGEGVEFIVVNPFDLALQEWDLMPSVLVVEVRHQECQSSVLWFRFDAASVVSRGMSACRLFSDDNPDEGVPTASSGGVCGWVIDRKRM